MRTTNDGKRDKRDGAAIEISRFSDVLYYSCPIDAASAVCSGKCIENKEQQTRVPFASSLHRTTANGAC